MHIWSSWVTAWRSSTARSAARLGADSVHFLIPSPGTKQRLLARPADVQRRVPGGRAPLRGHHASKVQSGLAAGHPCWSCARGDAADVVVERRRRRSADEPGDVPAIARCRSRARAAR